MDNSLLKGFRMMLVLLISGFSTIAETRTRTEVSFPELPGLITLRCDFHLHTVFSDGDVWPTTRVEEAWRDGLDAIALTDHIEYQPHKKDLPTQHGRSHELASSLASNLGILLIRAAEITRGEPPGHLNALFLTNAAELNQTNYREAISNAFRQGAFLFWNHPGWKQPGRKAVWYAEQGEFLENGWLQGLEVVNGSDYEPIVHGWALEKHLAIIGNSDAHDPINFDYDRARGEIRPMTLVFAKTRDLDGIKEALQAQRTIVFSDNRLIGNEEILRPFFENSVQVVTKEIRLPGKSSALVQLRNVSAVDFDLRLNPKLPELDVPERLRLPAGKVTLLQVRCLSERVTGEQTVAVPCRVTNAFSGPEKPLRAQLTFRVKYGKD